MKRRKVSNLLILCSFLLVLGFIIKILVHGLLNTLNQEKWLFSTLECILPAIILMIVGFYLRRHDKSQKKD
ncbi:hypothetical protein DFR55_10391 [Herbinix hemicellulosilytica]|uniref:Uncharacterized protein n=1 Tax=Herbinix hemicellulosilytica TaxID=1564487 RepID=A0A0H5SG94_HERHM|nr:hypothetical protein [Herbinix hemicellulosilytica]RBP60107.1 hypothetical protein DFR55_10391 [Herbinix hemicellulosilytica]CRZ33831.1 hypothetical protein HHT355_0627 [Herbinix hemicellulosilytica]